MSLPSERLRLLLRQAGGRSGEPGAVDLQTLAQSGACGPPPEPRGSQALPALNTLLRRLGHSPADHQAGPGALQARRETLPGIELQPGLQLIESLHPQDACPTLQFDHAELGQVDTRRLLAIDTETTGLSGGSGTRAFLIGAADWREGRLRVRQLLLTSLVAEGAMLDAFCGWIAEAPVLLSYNGKCFDVPLLRTRLRMLRRCAKPLDLPHVDLLYGVRRRYRRRWDDCRLATAERELLDIARHNDMPGSEAPAAFRRWLIERDALGITRAATHNAQDLVSLMQLAIRLGGEQATPW